MAKLSKKQKGLVAFNTANGYSRGAAYGAGRALKNGRTPAGVLRSAVAGGIIAGAVTGYGTVKALRAYNKKPSGQPGTGSALSKRQAGAAIGVASLTNPAMGAAAYGAMRGFNAVRSGVQSAKQKAALRKAQKASAQKRKGRKG